MDFFPQISAHISKNVPYANHTGVQLLSIEGGNGIALLPKQKRTLNHIGSQHAGALFTLGETASGAAMAANFLPVLDTVRSVAANASIQYKRIAKGPIQAIASLSESVSVLIDELRSTGKTQFTVQVTMRDNADCEVAAMQIDWHLSQPASQ